MSEREIIKSVMDFSFLIKSQLHSDNTIILRSILTILIMESEDIIEVLDHAKTTDAEFMPRSAEG